MINNLLDVVVEFFWVEVVARRDQATPHKGYGSGKPAAEWEGSCARMLAAGF